MAAKAVAAENNRTGILGMIFSFRKIEGRPNPMIGDEKVDLTDQMGQTARDRHYI